MSCSPWRRPPARPVVPARVPPVVGLMRDEFDTKPFGSSGMTLPSQPPAPALAQEPFVIPPPDWEAEARERGLDPVAPEPPPELDALSAIKLAAEDEDELWPAPPGQSVEFVPLLPVKLPEPDWREEEREATRRNARTTEFGEPTKSLQRRPA